MALRMYPVSRSRWARLAASRLPIDLTERTDESADDRGRKLRAEHALIQGYVDALEPKSAWRRVRHSKRARSPRSS